MAKSKNLHYYLLLLVFITCTSFQGDVRQRVQFNYNTQLGVREASGHNDGLQVEQYLKYVGLKKGQPWCAAFVCWVLGRSEVKNPRVGGCVNLLEKGKTIVYRAGRKMNDYPRKGDVFFIWYASKNRVAHTGFVDSWGATWVKTIEGNTNDAGSREGDGVYRKRRLKRQLYAVVSFIS